MSSEEYIRELIDERDRLEPTLSAHSIRLLEDEINRVRSESMDYGPPKSQHAKHEPYTEETVKLIEKIVLPVEAFPKFNFVGKILGPGGGTLKLIVALTKTKISVLGRGSTRDREKEEELSQSDDAKHEHFKEPLHVLIQAEAPRSEAHQRIADAMEEINKALSPPEISSEPPQHGAFNNVNVRHQSSLPVTNLPSSIADAIARQFPGVHGMQAPIIRVGIPPPGALVLNEGQLSRGRGTQLAVSHGGGDRHRVRTSERY